MRHMLHVLVKSVDAAARLNSTTAFWAGFLCHHGDRSAREELQMSVLADDLHSSSAKGDGEQRNRNLFKSRT